MKIIYKEGKKENHIDYQEFVIKEINRLIFFGNYTIIDNESFSVNVKDRSIPAWMAHPSAL